MDIVVLPFATDAWLGEEPIPPVGPGVWRGPHLLHPQTEARDHHTLRSGDLRGAENGSTSGPAQVFGFVLFAD